GMAVGSSADSRPPRIWRTSNQPTQARLASLSANLGFAASTTSSATDSSGILSFAQARLSRSESTRSSALSMPARRCDRSARWVAACNWSFCLRSARSTWRESMRYPPSVRLAQGGAVAREFGEAGGEELGAAAEGAGSVACCQQPATDTDGSGNAEREQPMFFPEQHGQEDHQENQPEAEQQSGQHGVECEAGEAELFFLEFDCEQLQPRLRRLQPGIDDAVQAFGETRSGRPGLGAHRLSDD